MINGPTLNNSLTRANSAEITHFQRPDYSAGVSLATGATIQKNGFVRVDAGTQPSGTSCDLYIDGFIVRKVVASGSVSINIKSLVPVFYGETLTFPAANVKFFPCIEG